MEQDIHKLHRAVTTILRALKIAETNVQVAHRELAFVPADIQTMRFVSAHPGCKLVDVAAHLGVVPTTASSVVDRLVDRGFVKRDRPENNRRSIALALTRDGTEAFSRLEREELMTMETMLTALPESERAQFVASMTTIADSVSADQRFTVDRT